MSVDLDRLLSDASSDPAVAPDVDALWAAGRRRRRARLLGTTVTSIAALVVVGAVGVALSSTLAPTIEPADTPETTPPAEPDEAATDDPEATDDSAPDGAPGEDADDYAPTLPAPMEPDPALVEDPCAPYAGHFDESGMAVPGTPGETSPLVIDVVSPVDGQQVADVIELVGCARVFEATVRYRLLDPDGVVLVDDFTTASAGGPMIGEFRAEIPIEATGVLTLEVFWEDAKDGSDRDVVTIDVDAP